ncbi:MAG: hypothetical protein AMS18_13805, partial [Gemmatimonas sp. SG8_17]
MKILVTGADGFVGSLLSRRLAEQGHDVTGGLRPDGASDAERARRANLAGLRTESLELLEPASVRAVAGAGWDTVIHLAAVSSVSDAERDPARAWEVNTLGTARLVNELGETRLAGADPLLLLVSSAE